MYYLQILGVILFSLYSHFLGCSASMYSSLLIDLDKLRHSKFKVWFC